MMRYRAVAALVLLAAGRLSAQATPEMVGRGLISTEAPEFALTLTPDGSELYFNRATANRSAFAIMVSRRTPGGWSEPVVAPFSGTWRDADPFITPDGRRLYFSSDRPRAGAPPESFSTWYVDRLASGWSEPVDPGAPLNSDSTDIFVSATRAGTVVFSSARLGATRIFQSQPDGSGWRQPVALELTPGDRVGNPAISPSGRFMVLVRPVEGRGGELFFTCRTATGWTPLAALPEPINSRWTEFAPSIDAAEQTLYFTSERPGIVGAQPDSVRPPGDLYQVPLAGAGVHCPQ